MRNDGTETTELHESNVFEIQSLRAQLNIAQGGETDAYNQLRESFVLLKKSRNLLEITALESPLRKDILLLIQKIDKFYPQAKEK